MSTAHRLSTSPASNIQSELPALLCSRCSAALAQLTELASAEVTDLRCARCGAHTLCDQGIWRCLSSEQRRAYGQFIADYQCVRASEGRGSPEPAYYLALPYNDLSGKLSTQWKIRARTFEFMKRHILAPRARRQARPLRILDLGAGNGWLSYRLALLGHVPTAVDLLTNSSDGLGAGSHYGSHLPVMFPRIEASLDQLPFSGGGFDLVIFNASFHYSPNYVHTLAEALRCLRPGGAVVIADTPWYARHESGMRMVEEKRALFRAQYGFPSSSIPSQEFLTPDRLELLSVALGITWQTYTPFYGIRWSLRPLHAKLQRRRPPSHFRIYVGEAGMSEVTP